MNLNLKKVLKSALKLLLPIDTERLRGDPIALHCSFFITFFAITIASSLFIRLLVVEDELKRMPT